MQSSTILQSSSAAHATFQSMLVGLSASFLCWHGWCYEHSSSRVVVLSANTVAHDGPFAAAAMMSTATCRAAAGATSRAAELKVFAQSRAQRPFRKF